MYIYIFSERHLQNVRFCIYLKDTPWKLTCHKGFVDVVSQVPDLPVPLCIWNLPVANIYRIKLDRLSYKYISWALKSSKNIERLGFQSVWATWSTSRQNWTIPNKTERPAFAFSTAACSYVKWAQVWHHRSAIRWYFQKLSISNCLAYWPRHFSRVLKVWVIGWVDRAVLLTFPI